MFYFAPPKWHGIVVLGRVGEAQSAARAGLALDPKFTVARFRANSPSDNPTCLAQRERAYGGLRQAGVPEEWP
jgi:hypothetical protein